jgi:hypothetical protein
VAFNFCARYKYGVSRRDHIFDYANSLLGMPLGKLFRFRICCQMYSTISSGEPGGIIIPRHNYATTAASFFVRGAILWNDMPLSVREKCGVGKLGEKCRSFMEQTANNLFF